MDGQTALARAIPTAYPPSVLRRALSLILLSLLLAGCGAQGAESNGNTSLDGVDPSRDQGDRSCHVVLRQAGRRRDGAGYVGDAQSYHWFVELDVSEAAVAEGAVPELAFRVAGSSEPFRIAAATATQVFPFEAERRIGFQRYGAIVSGANLPAPGWSGTALSRARLEMVPYLRLAGGGRLYDHNRNPRSFDNYLVAATQTYDDDLSACPGVEALAVESPVTIRFGADGTITRDGAPWAGSEVTIEYALERITDCRGTHNGHPAWDLVAHARFLPSGEVASGTVRAFEAPFGVPNNNAHAVPFTTRVPAGTTELELWFENFTGAGSSCRAWDSAGGANHHFAVLSAPDWIGRAALRIDRDTSNAPCGRFEASPLGGTINYDTWARQRAALKNVCFEVYERGVTDRADSVLWRALDVRAYTRAGGSTEWRHLDLVDRIGNNARYVLDLASVDPFRPYHCPTVATHVAGMYVEAEVELYFSVNGAVLAGPDGAPVQIRFSDYPDAWRDANCP